MRGLATAIALAGAVVAITGGGRGIGKATLPIPSLVVYNATKFAAVG